MLSGDNGILQKATDAKTNTERVSIIEQARIDILAGITDKKGADLADNEIKGILGTYFNDVPEDLSDLTQKITTKNGGYTVELSEILNGVTVVADIPVIATLPTGAGTEPFLPSTAFHQLSGTTLTNGLVITDAADPEDTTNLGNEYVWIEVPNKNIEGDTPTFGPDYSNTLPAKIEGNLTDAQRTEIKGKLLAYTETLLPATGSDPKTTKLGWTDEYYDGCGIASPTAYNTLYDNMLKSVYNHGGFWIGRYEVGMTGNTGRADENVSIDGVVPLSKKYLIPIIYVTCSQAQTIATRTQNIDSKYNSSLMFGVQWDCVLMYLNKKGNVSVADLTSDSKCWGNYTDTTNAILTGGKYTQYMDSSYQMAFNTWYAYTDNLGDYIKNKVLNNANMPQSILLTTGSLPTTMAKQNIYDLAGNVVEWTLERATSTSGVPCVARGGYFVGPGSSYPASYLNADGMNVSNYNHRLPCFTLLKIEVLKSNNF